MKFIIPEDNIWDEIIRRAELKYYQGFSGVRLIGLEVRIYKDVDLPVRHILTVLDLSEPDDLPSPDSRDTTEIPFPLS